MKRRNAVMNWIPQHTVEQLCFLPLFHRWEHWGKWLNGLPKIRVHVKAGLKIKCSWFPVLWLILCLYNYLLRSYVHLWSSFSPFSFCYAKHWSFIQFNQILIIRYVLPPQEQKLKHFHSTFSEWQHIDIALLWICAVHISMPRWLSL